MKSILMALAIFASIPAFSQDGNFNLGNNGPDRPQDTQSIAEDVRNLVYNYADRLQERDRRYVQRGLTEIINLFADNGFYTRPPRDDRRLFCDSNDNTLRDLTNRQLIWDFGNKQNCDEALVYVSRWEPFCDYSDNTLRNYDGKMIHDFGNTNDCKVARDAVPLNKAFCDFSDNTLYDSTGKLLYDFGNADDCIKARDKF